MISQGPKGGLAQAFLDNRATQPTAGASASVPLIQQPLAMPMPAMPMPRSPMPQEAPAQATPQQQQAASLARLMFQPSGFGGNSRSPNSGGGYAMNPGAMSQGGPGGQMLAQIFSQNAHNPAKGQAPQVQATPQPSWAAQVAQQMNRR